MYTTLDTPLQNIMMGIDLSSVRIKHCIGHTQVNPIDGCGATEQEEKMGKRKSHSHKSFEIQYILEGRYDVFVDGKKSNLGAYDLIIYSPHCEHGSEFLSRHGDSINIWFDAEYPRDIHPCFGVVKDGAGSLRWLFEHILSEYVSRRRDSDAIINMLLSTLVLYTCRLLGEVQNVSMDALLKNVLDYIEMNYYLNLNINNLSEMMNVSKSYFHKLFRDATGGSPLQYINSVRIERAKDMLIKTDTSVLDISFAVGFEDARYFSRLFKKHTGMTPNKYRQLGKKKE